MYHNLLRILSVSTFLRICCYIKTRHNWLQCYWSKIEGVRLITLFINQDSSCLLPCLRYGFLLKTFLQISSTKLLGTEHLLKHMVETYGGNIWWKYMVETYGGNMWWKHVVETYGGNMFE